MTFFSLFLIAIGLAMDAFAVSISEGIVMKKIEKMKVIKIAFVFGAFQALMPYLGWSIGDIFSSKILKYNYLVATTLLILVGAKMIYDGYSCENEEEEKKSNLILLGIATSIDALAIGFSFAMTPNINIYSAIEVIGIVTFFISAMGVIAGKFLSQIMIWKTEYIGGIILIGMGIKTLVEHFI